MIDLELVPTGELWDGIARRHTGAVLIVEQPVTHDSAGTAMWYHGGANICAGLIYRALHSWYFAWNRGDEGNHKV